MKHTIYRVILSAVVSLACSAYAQQPYVFAGAGTDSAIVAGAGYPFNRYVAAEVSYFTVKDDGRFSGLGLAAIGSLPITGQLSLAAEFGMFRLDADNGSAPATTGGSPADTAAENVVGVGVGVRYALTERLAARAMLRHTESKAAIPSTDTITMQVTYSF